MKQSALPLSSALALVAALGLAGCDRDASAPEPAIAPSATPDGEKVSIIRDDVGIEREAEPMVPYEARIGFDDGGTGLSDAALAALGEALRSEQMKAGGLITLGGHTDSEGTDAANLRASQRRAEAVRDWFIEKGVAEARIEVIAFGEQNPIAINAKPDGTPDEAGRAKNRRVDLKIAVPPGTPPAPAEASESTLVDEIAGPASEETASPKE